MSAQHKRLSRGVLTRLLRDAGATVFSDGATFGCDDSQDVRMSIPAIERFLQAVSAYEAGSAANSALVPVGIDGGGKPLSGSVEFGSGHHSLCSQTVMKPAAQAPQAALTTDWKQIAESIPVTGTPGQEDWTELLYWHPELFEQFAAKITSVTGAPQANEGTSTVDEDEAACWVNADVLQQLNDGALLAGTIYPDAGEWPDLVPRRALYTRAAPVAQRLIRELVSAAEWAVQVHTDPTLAHEIGAQEWLAGLEGALGAIADGPAEVESKHLSAEQLRNLRQAANGGWKVELDARGIRAVMDHLDAQASRIAELEAAGPAAASTPAAMRTLTESELEARIVALFKSRAYQLSAHHRRDVEAVKEFAVELLTPAATVGNSNA